MTEKSLVIGGTVYHTVMTHWGPGKVLAYRRKDNLGLPTTQRVNIKWAFTQLLTNPRWCRLSELRKTPK